MKTVRVKSSKSAFTNKKSFFLFMQVNIAGLQRSGKVRTSETYMTTFSSFMRFMNGRDILLNDVDSELMIRYEAYLKANGVSMNTISFYMRILRAVYNRAVERGMVRQRDPFKHVYTGIDKTVKRAVPFKAIRQIKELDLEMFPSLAYARDLFLFSFYTRGMSFVDMAYLKKNNLNNGILTYRRKKTGQLLSIKWEKCMQDIVDKYPVNISSYLLPIIKNEEDDRRQYKNAICLINRKLKVIGEMLGIPHPLTMYVARHSWASTAKDKHIPIAVISEGMGHNSEKTTSIYLASLDGAIIDKANSLIIKGLMRIE